MDYQPDWIQQSYENANITPDQLDRWTHDIIVYLRSVRSIVTTQEIFDNVRGVREMPIENLRLHDSCEVSEEDPPRFKYIPKITRNTNKFINNIEELVRFVESCPHGTTYDLLEDAYSKAPRDIAKLHQDGLFVVLSPSRMKRQIKLQQSYTNAMTSDTASTQPPVSAGLNTVKYDDEDKDLLENEQDNTTTTAASGGVITNTGIDHQYAKDDVIFPATLIANLPTAPHGASIDAKYKKLWDRIVQENEKSITVQEFLKKHKYELLPIKRH